MIIFDLAALANDEHRRRFIDPSKEPDFEPEVYNNRISPPFIEYFNKETRELWKPNYKAYNEACGKDKPVNAVLDIYRKYFTTNEYVVVWSSHCESSRENAVLWMKENGISRRDLKLRPIDDTSPQEQLFERWLRERCSLISLSLETGSEVWVHDIDFVFSSHKPTIEMFRRRGVFVFDCNQEMNE